MRSLPALAFVLACVACTPPAQDAAAIDPASLVLPSSSTGAPAIDDLPVVVLTKKKLLLTGAPSASALTSMDLPIGIESMQGPIIEPLRAWLKDVHGHDMAVAIDSSATSERAMEILATCMDAGFDTFHVAVSREGATAQIPLAFGKADPPNAKPLTASIFRGGVILSVPAGTIAPACQGLGEGVALSRTDGVLDRDALARCITRVHHTYATNTAAVLVTRDTSFSDVVTLLDAIRKDAETDAISIGITQ